MKTQIGHVNEATRNQEKGAKSGIWVEPAKISKDRRRH